MGYAAPLDSQQQSEVDDLATAMTDEDLLLEYRLTNSAELFAELVTRYERELFAYLFRFMGDATAAEDVFQTAFLQLHLKCDTFEQGRTVRPWLYKIATNLAIDTLRRNRRHRSLRIDWQRHSGRSDQSLVDTLAGNEITPAEQLESRERGQWVRGAVDSLPEHLRAPVVLVYFQGLKYREAAKALALPVGTLKSRMHAALQKLRDYSQRLTPALATQMCNQNG